MKCSKLILGVVLLISMLFILGCGGGSSKVDDSNTQNVIPDIVDDGLDAGNTISDDNQAVDDNSLEEVELTACTTHSDCSDNNLCINKVCGKLSGLYEPNENCAQKCKLKDVKVKTSDGETKEMVTGKGSYTAAGALEWRIEKGPEHCSDDETLVPIEITKRSYGDLLTQEYITLKKNGKSDVLKHPKIASIAFTLEIEDLNVDCS